MTTLRINVPVLALVSLMLPAPSLHAQTQDTRLHERLTPRTADSVVALAGRAAALSLPTEPLIQKALEGQSKGAPDDLILRAVQDLFGRLEQASMTLGAEATDAELVAAAGAMQVGVSAETVRTVARAHEDGSLAVPLVVLTDMIRKGVAAETASDVVIQLVEARVDVEGLQRFRRLVERDIDLGAAPGEAALIRVRDALLEQRRGINDLEPLT